MSSRSNPRLYVEEGEFVFKPYYAGAPHLAWTDDGDVTVEFDGRYRSHSFGLKKIPTFGKHNGFKSYSRESSRWAADSLRMEV